MATAAELYQKVMDSKLTTEDKDLQRYFKEAEQMYTKIDLERKTWAEKWAEQDNREMFEKRGSGKDHGTTLIKAIEDEAKKFGATTSYVDTMCFQAPGFYRNCGYEEYGAIEGYPGGVTRHWFTKAL